MNKKEFLSALRSELAGLDREELTERLNFYSEMIDDLAEEGLAEDEAVKKIGSVGDIVARILADGDTSKTKRKNAGKLGVLEITLIILGSPLWISLLVAAFAVVISVYAVIWSVIVSFWAIFGSLVGGAASGVLMLVTECIGGNISAGLAMLGGGIFCAGLSIFCYYGCKAATKGAALLTGKSFMLILSLFSKKEEGR